MRTKRRFPIVEAAGVTLVPLEEYVEWLKKNGEAGRLRDDHPFTEKTEWSMCHRIRQRVPSVRGRCLKKPKLLACEGCSFNWEGGSARE